MLGKAAESRRRPTFQRNTLTQKRVEVTESVGDLANSKKKYYDRLLEIAETEHNAKMEMLSAKKNYYTKKSCLFLNIPD